MGGGGESMKATILDPNLMSIPCLIYLSKLCTL